MEVQNAAAVAQQDRDAPGGPGEAVKKAKLADGSASSSGPNRGIYVSNMPLSMTETDLWSIFAAFGEVKSVRLPPATTRYATRIGFVTMGSIEAAKAAIAGVDKQVVRDGRKLNAAASKAETTAPRDAPTPDPKATAGAAALSSPNGAALAARSIPPPGVVPRGPHQTTPTPGALPYPQGQSPYLQGQPQGGPSPQQQQQQHQQALAAWGGQPQLSPPAALHPQPHWQQPQQQQQPSPGGAAAGPPGPSLQQQQQQQQPQHLAHVAPPPLPPPVLVQPLWPLRVLQPHLATNVWHEHTDPETGRRLLHNPRTGEQYLWGS